MKIITKISGMLVFFALIGIFITAQPAKLTDNETAYAEEIMNNYINSDANLTLTLANYTLKVMPIVFSVNEKKRVDVFMVLNNTTKRPIKFTADLNSGEVIKNKNLKQRPKFFRKSGQDRIMINEALRIANNDSEIKGQFTIMNFTKIPRIHPHIQADNCRGLHVIFMPMMQVDGFGKGHNISVIDANISIEGRKVLEFGVRNLFGGENRRFGGENCTFPERPEMCDGENCTFPGEPCAYGGNYTFPGGFKGCGEGNHTFPGGFKGCGDNYTFPGEPCAYGGNHTVPGGFKERVRQFI
ncbi:MAG: hypothetical protein CVT90_01375 [Candidatus Altiarchaeales archaeon HGW-Altiarchaeales-3]|nr:MAG: hypothetical protein CVT90_01375 [Candidatus Altiarchaeales archaeon HGW-Altiarchaeales-3]